MLASLRLWYGSNIATGLLTGTVYNLKLEGGAEDPSRSVAGYVSSPKDWVQFTWQLYTPTCNRQICHCSDIIDMQLYMFRYNGKINNSYTTGKYYFELLKVTEQSGRYFLLGLFGVALEELLLLHICYM